MIEKMPQEATKATSQKLRGRVFGIELPVWENVMVAALWAVAVTGAFVAVSTYAVVTLQRDENRKSAEKVAELTTQSEQLRNDNLKLEAKLAPRIIDDAGIALLAKEVSPLKGKKVDIVAYEAMGSDVPALAMQIEVALRDAGLDPAVFTPFGGQGYVRGVLVRTEVGSSDELTSGVALLVKALSDAGLSADSWTAYPVGEGIAGSYNGPTDRHPDAKIRILIGSKP